MSEEPWYKTAIIYQLHVKCFYDSSGDGVGDFKGLEQKLDYLTSLGVTALWLQPFYPSPMRDDGYDISNYYDINPAYGNLRSFKSFLAAAHSRGLKVITELIINHTSDQHPWFQRARRAKPGSVYRDYYVWSDTTEKYKGARIIFGDFEKSNWTWDPVASSYYWHRFYSHQPDLNFDSPYVQKEVLQAMDFWFSMGVDGMRLDAIPYLYERENTNCENLPETHHFLKKLRSHLENKFPGRMLLAEANQWPKDTLAYFGKSDECHMAFNFPVMPRLFMAVQREDSFPIVDIMEQTPNPPEGGQWAIFLRNHDELTLEMVTDEERNYMYHIYATDKQSRINLGIRRRLATLMENNLEKIKLMNVLLFSLPGTPIIYYGDEIGMGDNFHLGDRNGVRTPMQWSPDRNGGFSQANPQKLYLPLIIDPLYHYDAVNVENQNQYPSSLLWWMRHLIATRKQFQAFGCGSLKFLSCTNPKVLAFIREYEEEKILVIINLSRHVQTAQVDLKEYKGYLPKELLSHNDLPLITENLYTFVPSPYGFYWLQLLKSAEQAQVEERGIKKATVSGHWLELFSSKRLLKELLKDYLPRARWFASKDKTIREIIIEAILPLNNTKVLIVEVSYADGLAESYLLPLAFSSLEEKETLSIERPESIIAILQTSEGEGYLYDAVYEEEFRDVLLESIARKKKIRASKGFLEGEKSKKFSRLRGDLDQHLESSVLKAEQSNSNILYKNTFVLKLYRKLEKGPNPELEISRFLTEKINASFTPSFAGTLSWHLNGGEPLTIGFLSEFIPNATDAWTQFLNMTEKFFEALVARKKEELEAIKKTFTDSDISFNKLDLLSQQLIGASNYDFMKLLGRRTGELHKALASNVNDTHFTPEWYTELYQKSLYQSFRSLLRRVFLSLKKKIHTLSEENKQAVQSLLKRERDILDQAEELLSYKYSCVKIRIHGDYHLGQLLYTGKDFKILDFEGEPARLLSDRRLKRSPLRDVAGMMRSFYYAAFKTVFEKGTLLTSDQELLKQWAPLWAECMGNFFWQGYIEEITDYPITLIPSKPESQQSLLKLFLLEKSIYEIGYELGNRPDWLQIPIVGLEKIIQNDQK